MKIRKFGSEAPFREYSDDDCAWCDAGRHAKWGAGGGVLYLTNDAGELRRLEGGPVFDGAPDAIVIVCRPATADEARREIAGAAS